MILLNVIACGGPRVTSDTALVGRVVDADGAPIVGLMIHTMEGQHRTDDDGRFVVEVQQPNRLARFTAAGVGYLRKAQPADDGGSVDIALPASRSARIHCPPVACDLTLSWDLGPGFVAQLRPTCSLGATLEIPSIPIGAPEATCTVGRGAGATPVDLDVDDRGDALWITETAVAVRIEVNAVEGELPSDCTVRVMDAEAAWDPEASVWTAEVRGPTMVHAVCGGRPARPVAVGLGQPEGQPVVLEWAATGPTLDLAGIAPGADEVVWMTEAGDWSLQLAPDADGQVLLPPLAQGLYRIFVRGEGQTQPLATPPPGSSAPGVATFSAAGSGALVGRLELPSDLEGGTVRAVLVPDG